MFSHSELRSMKPRQEILVSKPVKRYVGGTYLVYRQLLADKEATVIYCCLADFYCDGNNGEDKNRCQQVVLDFAH